MKRLAAMLLTLLLLAGCTGERKQIVIGVSQCSEDIWRTKLNDELRGAAHFYDNVSLRFASADDDSRKQVEQIGRFVRDRVDLLIVSPNQISTITPAVDAAYDAGIPVILFDRKTESDKYTAFMGADNVEIGNILGKYIASIMGGRGNVVEIQGLKGSSPAIDRHEGFVEALRSYPDIHLTASEYGGWVEEGGYQAMNQILAEGVTDFDAVFGQNDRMAKGARKALMEKGGGRAVNFFGVDALATEDGGLKDVIDGHLTATYLYPTRGDLVMELAMNILSGQPYERENRLESALVDETNARMLLMQEDEIAVQRQNLENLTARLDQFLVQYNSQKIISFLLVALIVLLIVIAGVIYRNYVTTKRLSAELAASNAAKLTFFTNLSHEFRTPLSLIAGQVEHLLGQGGLSSEQEKSLVMARKNANILKRLIGEILDFRKIESGKMKMDLSAFDLAAAVREWLTGFERSAEQKGIRLTLSGAEHLPVTADMYKMERILFNLLSNAFKYTPSGGRIEVSVTQEGSHAALTVADSGIGIPPDKLSDVFERFYQVDETSAGGTGIGLALVKSLAEMHGGSVSATSAVGKGSIFTVLLPLTQEGFTGESVSVEASAYTETFEDSYNGILPSTLEETADLVTAPAEESLPSILVIDDNEDIRTFIRSLLQGEYRILLAANGQDGLEKARKEIPDLVICDVMMPVMDGLACCRHLKAETVTSHIPVILLTAKSLDEQRAEGYDCGADAYISKPFSEKVLLSRIGNLLRSRIQLKEHYLETGEAFTQGGENDFLRRFRRIVRERISDPDLNVETLGQEIGLSRVQLYRKVKSLTGYAPNEIVRIMRLRLAENLLKTTGKTVSEIAYEVGFSSPSYFTRCYRDLFGKSPIESKSP